MFTQAEIQEASAKVQTGADFLQFVRDLAAMGVTHYDTWVIKSPILLLLLTLLTACSSNPLQTNNPPLPSSKIALCPNEITLLQDDRNNWEVPLDSIECIDEYHQRCREQIRKFYAEPNPTIDAKVYPYVVIDSIHVSLMHLLRPSGGGYFGHPGDYLWIYYGEKDDYAAQNTMEAVREFYLNYIPSMPTEYEGLFHLPIAPMVMLTFIDQPLIHLKSEIKEIATGYIQAIRILALRHFPVDLCALDAVNLQDFKQKYPLKIRLMNGGKRSRD